MDQKLRRVIEALELRVPDRVPVMDVMEEYSNIYEILGKKPLPLCPLFSNNFTRKVVNRSANLLNRLGIINREMDHFSYDRTAASVKMGYDATWVMHVPIWKFSDSGRATDIYGRYYEVVFDKKGNLSTPMYKGGLIKSPDDWKAWEKKTFSGLLKEPTGHLRASRGISVTKFLCLLVSCMGLSKTPGSRSDLRGSLLPSERKETS